jgi:hypothetical protein
MTRIRSASRTVLRGWAMTIRVQARRVRCCSTAAWVATSMRAIGSLDRRRVRRIERRFDLVAQRVGRPE